MMYGDPPSIVRLNPFAPAGEAPRPHPKAAHPPLVVAQVRHLVETTTFPFRVIAVRTGVNSGTIARWTEKHGWTRPPGAWPRNARPERRYEPVLIGRGLATRLRLPAARPPPALSGGGAPAGDRERAGGRPDAARRRPDAPYPGARGAADPPHEEA